MHKKKKRELHFVFPLKAHEIAYNVSITCKQFPYNHCENDCHLSISWNVPSAARKIGAPIFIIAICAYCHTATIKYGTAAHKENPFHIFSLADSTIRLVIWFESCRIIVCHWSGCEGAQCCLLAHTVKLVGKKSNHAIFRGETPWRITYSQAHTWKKKEEK